MRVLLLPVLGCVVLLAGCGGSSGAVDAAATRDAASGSDGGVGADAASDSGSAIDAAPDSDASIDAASVDSGPTIDAGGPLCGTTWCAPSQYCCAVPRGELCCHGETCIDLPQDPSFCGSLSCSAPTDCTGGTECCTDGTQSICMDPAFCTDRSCRTAADCHTGEVCCPFGDAQQACRTAC